MREQPEPKVGQVWRSSSGRLVKIAEVTHGLNRSRDWISWTALPNQVGRKSGEPYIKTFVRYHEFLADSEDDL